MRVRLRQYNWKGDKVQDSVFDTPELAHAKMVQDRLPALAHPEDATAGAYNYRPDQDGHTLSLFISIMECCCNDIVQYHESMKDKGIL